MHSHDPFFVAPPITEIPDYVWAPRYCSYLPPVRKPVVVDAVRRVFHPSAEAALLAAKRSCRGCPGRWFGGGSPVADEKAAFLVYEGGKVVERHVVRGGE